MKYLQINQFGVKYILFGSILNGIFSLPKNTLFAMTYFSVFIQYPKVTTGPILSVKKCVVEELRPRPLCSTGAMAISETPRKSSPFIPLYLLRCFSRFSLKIKISSNWWVWCQIYLSSNEKNILTTKIIYLMNNKTAKWQKLFIS